MADPVVGENLKRESEKVVNLKGMPGNPGRDPKKTPKAGAGSIGDVAFRDALIIVVLAWAVLIFLAYSLRHHNI